MGTHSRILSPMANFADSEFWDVLRTNMRSAIQHCVDLANMPAQGPTYVMLRDELRTIETACRQLGNARQDMRFHKFGFEMASFQQRLGDCLRLHVARDVFMGMAQFMRGALYTLERLHSRKTGRRGPILPKGKPAPHRDTRPVQVSAGGILLPN